MAATAKSPAWKHLSRAIAALLCLLLLAAMPTTCSAATLPNTHTAALAAPCHPCCPQPAPTTRQLSCCAQSDSASSIPALATLLAPPANASSSAVDNQLPVTATPVFTATPQSLSPPRLIPLRI